MYCAARRAAIQIAGSSPSRRALKRLQHEPDANAHVIAGSSPSRRALKQFVRRRHGERPEHRRLFTEPARVENVFEVAKRTFVAYRRLFTEPARVETTGTPSVMAALSDRRLFTEPARVETVPTSTWSRSSSYRRLFTEPARVETPWAAACDSREVQIAGSSPSRRALKLGSGAHAMLLGKSPALHRAGAR